MMPAGQVLINHVASQLLPNSGKRFAEIYKGVTLKATPRAVRYAVAALITGGQVRRQGNLVFAASDLTVSIVSNAGGFPVDNPVPLLECFPDDPDGYAAAKADLLKDGTHRGGGGAAAEYVLKLAEAA